MAPAPELVSALNALYGTDPGLQQQANSWLDSYAKGTQAWQGALSLLNPAIPLEAQFFGCTMLLQKIKRDWGQLQPQDTATAAQQIRDAIQQLRNNSNTATVLLGRCTLISAALTAACNQEVAVAEQLLNVLQSASADSTAQVLAAVEELAALGELLAETTTSRHAEELHSQFQQHGQLVHRLLSALAALLQQIPNSADAECQLVLHAMQHWAVLAGRGYSVNYLWQRQRDVFEAVLRCFGCTTSAPLETVADFLADRLSQQQEDATIDIDGVRCMLAAMVQHGGPRAQQPQEGPLALALARVLSDTAEVHREMLRWHGPEMPGVLELVAALLRRGDRNIAGFVLNMVYETTFLEPGEQPNQNMVLLHQHLLPLLVPPLASYPVGFVSWDECVEDDQEDFERFREGALTDVLECSYVMLQYDYLSYLGSLIQQAASSEQQLEWRNFEAALFALQAASDPIQSPDGYEDDDDEPTTAPPAQSEKQQRVNNYLTSLFQHLLSLASLLQYPYLLQQVARTISAFGSYLSYHPELIPSALKCMVNGQSVPKAGSVCAMSFWRLCSKCGNLLPLQASQGMLLQLTQQLHEVFQQVSVSLRNKDLLARGIAALVAAANAQPAAQTVANGHTQADMQLRLYLGQQMLGPVLEAINLQLTLVASVPNALTSLHGWLGVCNAMLAGAESHAPPDHMQENVAPTESPMSLLKAMQQAAAPVLMEALNTPAVQAHAACIEVICKMYGLMLSDLAEQRGSMSECPQWLPVLVAVYQRHMHSACLSAISGAIEAMTGADVSPQVAGALQQAFVLVTEASTPGFQNAIAGGSAVPSLAGHGSIAADYMHLAQVCAVHLPSAITESTVATENGTRCALLQLVLPWVAASIQQRDADIVREACAVLTALCAMPPATPAPSGRAQAMLSAWFTQTARHPGVQQAVSSSAASLANALLISIAELCPTPTLRWATNALYFLLQHPLAQQLAAPAATTTLLQPGFGGVEEHILPREVKQQCLQLLLKQPPMELRRFQALCTDLARVARLEETSDAILAYHL